MPKSINHRYVLESSLGVGGMGVIHRAFDRLTRETVALKQVYIPPQQLQFMSRTPSMETYDLRLSLTREFQTLASLRHPHIISVLDYGFDEEQRPFYTMTYLPEAQDVLTAGEDLTQSKKLELVQQILQALIYLHRQGIYHRDLKPDNVQVTAGHVRVLDFGLAMTRTEESASPSGGTLAYWAPELWLGEPFTEAADLFAVGVMAFELLAGQHPFAPVDSFLLDRVLDEEPDWSLLEMKPALTAVLQKLLAKDPQTRYQKPEHVLQDLAAAMGESDVIETAAIRESYLHAAMFVGREAEMAQLQNALRQAQEGMGSMWLLGGESGVGKSRLLNEVRIQALVSGWQVIRGQAIFEGGGNYQLWQDVMPYAILGVQLTDLEASVLKAITPKLEQLLDCTIPDPPTIDGPASLRRLMLTLVDILYRQNQPTLLLLEDLQWSGESLTPLQYLLRTIKNHKLVIIGSYRNDERPDLPQTLSGAHSLHLDRLGEMEIAQLSQAILGQQVVQRTELVSLLHQQTEGNTFFLVEIIRALAEEAGQLADIQHMALPQQVLTSGMTQLVRRRLEKIPPLYQPLLEQAAVAGRALNLPVLTHLNNNVDLDTWLDMGQSAAVLTMQDNRWYFAHDKLREVLLSALPPAVLSDLHQQVAEAIEYCYPADSAQAGTLAIHWHHAGNWEKELQYAQLAGEHAAAQFANEDALHYLTRAQTLAPVEQREQRYAILLARAQVYELVGNREAQKQDLVQLVALAAELGHLQKQAEATLRQADYYEAISDFANAVTAAQKAVELAQLSGDKRLEAQGKQRWGYALHYQGQPENAITLLEESLELFRQQQDERGEAATLNRLGTLMNDLKILDKARAYFDASLLIFRHINDKRWEGAIANNLGNTAYFQGTYKDAQKYYQAGRTIFQEIGDRRFEANALYNLGNVARNQVMLEDAAAYYHTALDIYHELGDLRGKSMAFNSLGLLAKQQNDFETAYTNYHASLAIRQEIGDKRGEAMLLGNLGTMADALGERDEAKTYITTSLDIYREVGDRAGEAHILMNLGILLTEQGVYDDAFETLLLAYSIQREQGASRPFEWLILQFLGNLACLQNRYEEAEAYFQQSLAINETGTRQQFAMENLAGLAEVALARGDFETAQDCVNKIVVYQVDHPSFSGAVKPFVIFSRCIQALIQLQDPRVERLLKAAYDQLNEAAAKIKTQQRRYTFLENVPAHKQIVLLYNRIVGQ